MVACQIAYSMFHTPTKIARIRSQGYLAEGAQLFKNDHIPVDVLISPERLVTDHIERIIEHPGALQVVDFAEGRVRMVGVTVDAEAPMKDKAVWQLSTFLPDVETRITAVFRDETAIIPDGDTVIHEDDVVFFLAMRRDTRDVMGQFRTTEKRNKRIMIAGGGNIGAGLARKLERSYSVKVIEYSRARSQQLAENLRHTIVLHGSASDQDLLLQENIEDTDVFLALTNDDEANIMSSMLAKRLGARKVMALINNPAYVDLVQGGEIDIAISPQLTTIGSLLTHVRRGDMVSVHSLRRGAAEAIEVIAHGDESNSKVVGKPVDMVDLPQGATIGAIVREKESGPEVVIAHDDTVIESGDHVIVFLVDKKYTRDVEKLFQVGFSFF